MVWQVRDNKPDSSPEPASGSPVSPAVEPTSPIAPIPINPEISKLEVESRSSRGSSSTVDLGPAPGSGLTTSDHSDAEQQKFERQPSLGVEMTESMTTSSLLQFNRDVESLLENHDEPPEDFTQHFNS